MPDPNDFEKSWPKEEKKLSPAMRDLVRQIRTKKTQREYEAEGERIRNAQPKAKP